MSENTIALAVSSRCEWKPHHFREKDFYDQRSHDMSPPQHFSNMINTASLVATHIDTRPQNKMTACDAICQQLPIEVLRTSKTVHKTGKKRSRRIFEMGSVVSQIGSKIQGTILGSV